MRDVISLIWVALVGLLQSRVSLEAEILALRHQLNVLRRKSPRKLTFTSMDRLVFAGLYRLAPGALDALKIVRPETVIRWHRTGSRAYWRWKSRPRGGRPKTLLGIRHLIREMSLANPLWAHHGSMDDRLKLSARGGQASTLVMIVRWLGGKCVIASLTREYRTACWSGYRRGLSRLFMRQRLLYEGFHCLTRNP
jgi:hypothetical protein